MKPVEREEKTCADCGETKSLLDFPYRKSRICHECNKYNSSSVHSLSGGPPSSRNACTAMAPGHTLGSAPGFACSHVKVPSSSH